MAPFRNGLGRVSAIFEGTSQVATAQLMQSTFDNRGLLDTMQRATAGSAFLTDFTFDPIGRLSSFANDAAGTANDLTIGQTFNPASQIVSQTRSNDAYSWTGSVLFSRNYTTNGLNQYTAAGPASFTYDPNGNLTADGSTTFVYDIENRLVSASGANTASLVYNPMGRLFETSGGTGGITRFVYDGDELVVEYDAAGTMAHRYVHSDNVDDPVVQYDGAAVGTSARTFLMPDERGSIVGLIYNDGTSRAINSYDEYGIPGAGNQGRFQYTGQIWIPELGMYHYKARLYSPTLGRFLQIDPIGYDGGIALYAYVGNDPVNRADPSGNESIGQYFEGVYNDIKDFGSAIARGDFEYALGGLPPTLGGGVVTEGMAAATAVQALRLEAATTRAAAAELRSATSVTSRTTRAGERAVTVESAGGKVKDISPTRVKEATPNTHTSAPAGAMQKTKFENAQPGSKGFKRDPTSVEQRMLKLPQKPGIICRSTGYFC